MVPSRTRYQQLKLLKLGQSHTRYQLISIIGEDPAYVITATHGKRVVDCPSHFKLHIKEHEMDEQIAKLEEFILFFTDVLRLHGPSSNSEIVNLLELIYYRCSQ